MFTHSIDPVLFSIGPFAVRWYGIIFALGFVIVLLYLQRMRRLGTLELSEEQLYDLIVWLIVGTVVGARLFEVLLWEPSYYFSHPYQIIAVWNGGLSFHGGLAGAIVACWIFCRRNSLQFLKLADAITVPAVFALALGRIANFINAELVGSPTSLPWCVNFPGVEGCRHPVQLYGAAGRFAASAILFLAASKKPKDGFILLLMMLLLGIGRFFMDFLREDTIYLGLSTGQYLSIAIFAVAAFFIARHYRRDLALFLFGSYNKVI